MTAEQVAEIVRDQMEGWWDDPTPHDLDMRRSILDPPVKRMFISRTRDQEHRFELWLVYEEDPDRHAGYQVFFDEESERFGLATPVNASESAYIGEYGDLWETLEAM